MWDFFRHWIIQEPVGPVLRNAGNMNFAEIEKEINTQAKKANEGCIWIDEMAGGTFTISNGGVYGSLLSTPIINPPRVLFYYRMLNYGLIGDKMNDNLLRKVEKLSLPLLQSVILGMHSIVSRNMVVGGNDVYCIDTWPPADWWKGGCLFLAPCRRPLQTSPWCMKKSLLTSNLEVYMNCCIACVPS